jgi:hypothetical protein
MRYISSRNPFFNNFSSSQEQDLLESLIIEAHSIYAPQMWYIPRILNNEDNIYTADDQSSYEDVFLIPVFIENFDRFTGDGSFMSKFNLEIHNQIQVSIAVRTFQLEVAEVTGQVRPNEGDVIFFPQNNHCFQIKYVEKFEMFYPLGKLYVWQATCELFEYSNELFNTGIAEVDALQKNLSTNIFDYALLDEDDAMLLDENDHYLVMEQYDLHTIVDGNNEDFKTEAEEFIDWDETDPFSQGGMREV